jgi:hypothetical protein
LKHLIFLFTLLCLLAIMPDPVPAMEFGSDIYPSETELLEAYLTGDIDFMSYLNLRELIENGIDTTELYLLEEVPNLSYYLEGDLKDYTWLQTEQAEPFLSGSLPHPSRSFTGTVRWRRFQKLESAEPNRNELKIRTRLSPNWTLKALASDDYDGREEWSYRSLEYVGDRGPVKKLAIGNYTARYGLGVSVGYRGRLLEKEELESGETLVFPDYGGFNGVYAEGGRRKQRIKWLAHYDRNDEFRFLASALSLSRRLGRFELEGIALTGRIDKRQEEKEYQYYQLGTFVGYDRENLESGLELAFQEGVSDALSAGLLETRYRLQNVDMRFSAWYYAEDFKNLTGGGRSGYDYETIYIDTIDFRFTDRRNDQRGMLFRTKSALGERMRFDASFSVYGSGRYDSFVEILAVLDREVGGRARVRFYNEYDRENRHGEIITDNQFKVEYRTVIGPVSLRSYLGYRYDSRDRKFLAHFTRIRLSHRVFKNIELWLNLGRYNFKTNQLDYFYGFVRESVEILPNFELGAKYIYRYNRNYYDRTDETFQLDLIALW